MKRLNTETFKARVIERFGDIFDLSKVEYKKSKEKVCIISQSKGCPKCVLENRVQNSKITIEEFIKRSTEIHKGKYIYTEVNFENGVDDCVDIVCPIHGKFRQRVANHLRGASCPVCSNREKYTIDIFKNKFVDKYGEIFDFSLAEYKGSKTKMKCICPIHGEFQATPNFLMRQGRFSCRKCYHEEDSSKSKRKPFNKFLKEAITIHGDKYIYDESTYKTTHDKMKIKCKECGYEFEQTPNAHVGKEHNGCPQCARKLVGRKCRKTFEEFETDARKIHGDKYIYHDDYINAQTKIKITCPIHGDFYQRTYDHIFGRKGCPICSESHLEKEVRLFLTENNINFEYQKRFDWLGKQSFDFYLPEFNIAIECQGKQHFGKGGWLNNIDNCFDRDIKKNKLSSDNSVRLIYYTNYDNKTVIFNHETNLYNEGNTFFNLEFLNEFKEVRKLF